MAAAAAAAAAASATALAHAPAPAPTSVHFHSNWVGLVHVLMKGEAHTHFGWNFESS
jgi:uncharacterized RmlC-like cupin family protein